MIHAAVQQPQQRQQPTHQSSLRRSLAADLEITNLFTRLIIIIHPGIMAKADSDLLNRDLVSHPPSPPPATAGRARRTCSCP